MSGLCCPQPCCPCRLALFLLFSWFSQGQGLVLEWGFQGSPCDNNGSHSPLGRNPPSLGTSCPLEQERRGPLLCGQQVVLPVSLPTFPMAQHPGLGGRRGLVLAFQEGVLEGDLEGMHDVKPMKFAMRVPLPLPSLVCLVTGLSCSMPSVSNANMKL